jgi:DNA modification methylase
MNGVSITHDAPASSTNVEQRTVNPLLPDTDSLNLRTTLNVRSLPISALQPHPRNARTHSKHQIHQLAESIRIFGFTNPILVDKNDRIIAGHGRWRAAKGLGMTQVPVIPLENLTDDQIQAYILADNKLAENAGWDKEILAIELQHLMTIEGLDFDVTVTGFEIPEIDIIIGDSLQAAVEPEVVAEPDEDQQAVSQPGDLWQLGPHRIFCGDSLEDASYESLMRMDRAAAVFTDPPYNVKVDGHATGNGKIKHREFAMASGEMTDPEFFNFIIGCIALLIQYSCPQSVHYLCMDWAHIETLLAAGRQHYNQLLNLCVWVKDNGGMGSFYRSQHELIAVFRNGKKPHRNNVQLGKFGRNRTNVWQYPGVQTLSKQGDEGNLLTLHPTVKPIKMVADAILDCTKPGDIVLDAFLGSGTSLMAAERVHRVCYGIEIDPLYVDTAIQRWQKYTGGEAVHATTTKSFAQIGAERTVTNA